MKIQFDKLCTDKGITINKLANDMTEANHFKNIHSAEVVIYKHIKGKTKHPVSYDILKWLSEYFNVSGAELFEWN